jgi:hypothetical protein
MHPVNGLLAIVLMAISFSPVALYAQGEGRSLELASGESMDLRVFPAPKSKDILLWFPCDQGMGTAEVDFADELAAAGQEVWLADLLGMYFLPVAPSSMRTIQGQEVVETIEMLQREDGRPIYLVSAGFGSIPVLRGARLWKEKYADTALEDYIAGIILLYPELHGSEPEPGHELNYLPVVSHTSTPVMIMQPQLTPARFWLHRLTAMLESGGAAVQTEILPGVRGYFFVKQASTPAEDAMTLRLPSLVLEARDRLAAQGASE